MNDRKLLLYQRGRSLCEAFLRLNDLPEPEWEVGECRLDGQRRRWHGWYEPITSTRGTVRVDVSRCSLPSASPYSWSWPGYKADLTPYGVVAHEVGHHLHRQHRGGLLCHAVVQDVHERERPLTSYEPNWHETVAESAKLFITNPTLLQLLRPARYEMIARCAVPFETRGWEEILAGSPRHLEVVMRHQMRLLSRG